MTKENQPVEIGSFRKTEKAESAAKMAISAFMTGGDPFAAGDEAPKTVKSEAQLKKDAPDDFTEQALKSALDMVEQVPEKTWEQKLKEHDINKEEAFKIIDAMLTKGFYERTYQLTKKTAVTFRTRSFEHQEIVQRAIENDAPQYMGTVSLLMSKYNLAASLIRVGKTTFERGEDGKDYTQAFKFLSKLPYMVFNALIQKLAKFDRLVLTVMDEGALENF